MESDYKNDPDYQFANQDFLDECDYLRLTEKVIDNHIKQGTLTASHLSMLIDSKIEVRAASEALHEARTDAILVQMRKDNPVIKRPLWKRLLKK